MPISVLKMASDSRTDSGLSPPKLDSGICPAAISGVVLDATMGILGKMLTLTVNTAGGGDIKIQIPRTMLDAKCGQEEIQFHVLVDGSPAEYEEIASGEQFRETTVFVPQDSNSI
ncbi:MAG TPA: hypothetical protein VF172_05445 [Nitrososphaera sp.]